MTQSRLIAHRGTNYVEESEIRSVAVPAWTRTWHPVAHRDLIDALEIAVREHDMEVMRRQYAMNSAGSRLFGVWDIAGGNGSIGSAIGFRNATDKSMAVGITVGTRVFVCDNLAISGDFIAFRRHTAGLTMDSLIEMLVNAVGQVRGRMKEFMAWHESLALVHLTPDQAYIVTWRILSEGILPGRSFKALHDLLYVENKYDPLTLWGQHEAATELLTRNGNLLTVSRAHRKLNMLMDTVGSEIAYQQHCIECRDRSIPAIPR